MGRAFEYRKASKEKRWDKMSKLFPKLGSAITLAAKDGGDDPEVNTKLRAAIATAKAENMPKDNIEKAIARATSKDCANFSEVNYEAKGPHGALIWVECATDNNTRTFSKIRTIFNKNGGQLMSSGSLEFMFTRKTIIHLEKTANIKTEDIELTLIDSGLEEFFVEENEIIIIGSFTSFGSLSKSCEELNLNLTKSSVQRIANESIKLTEEQIEEVEALIEKLDDDEDVQNVFTNIS